MAKALFITYDGLTDTLGQSQILPYLTGLAKQGHEISILSCEKRDRFSKYRQTIQDLCTPYSINWFPLSFHKNPPIISKFYDLYQLKQKASELHKRYVFDIIHCRSYIAAEIGLKMKKSFGTRFLFDMRSFWVDERVDGGLWNPDSIFYKVAYKKWKQKEAVMIEKADHIISLTEAGKKEIKGWKSYKDAPITVIPCSADMDLFSLTSIDQQKEARKLLGLADNTFVLSYLGSLGTWYLLDEMLLFFKKLKDNTENAKFLILTPDEPQQVLNAAGKYGLKPENFIIQFAQRKELPGIIKASDVSISFIKPAYSKISSSPTKLGELLAMGIPVVCNDIGDVKMIIQKSGGGYLIPEFSDAAFHNAIEMIPALMNKDKALIRNNIFEYYTLANAIKSYNNVYQHLMNIN